MRKMIALNNGWYYRPEYTPGLELNDDLCGFERVNLPHTNIELPYNYLDEKSYQFQSCYKYPLMLAPEDEGKIVYLHFEGVMAYAQVYLNDELLGEHKGGYTPFAIRIDQAYCFNAARNLLTVVVDSNERKDIPPFGGRIDYLTYGGIYREVTLGIYDELFIKNLKVEAENVLAAEKRLRVKVFLGNPHRIERHATLRVTLQESDGVEVATQSFNLRIRPEQELYLLTMEGLRDLKLWSVEEPVLYQVRVRLEGGESTDEYADWIGFRTAEFKTDGFYLNGVRLKLRGLNRHQAYPYVGYAMPKRIQEKDATILKEELRLNLVRTSHYPQSRHFLNQCDRLGLLVFEELPGWQHLGDEEWKQVALANLREMIERDWNHPSIILWGVRINESRDDPEFYTATNELARRLDPTRPTGGVRHIPHSQFLEDVFTFNDFARNGTAAPLRAQQEVTGLPYKVPYLITEFGGHMFPTKRFDQEERQIEHALRHLRVLNQAGLDDSIAGTVGWCAFDYNTHADFGSGDRICYHGVMDMFRLPKFAAAVYKSQVSPAIEPVLEPVTIWARGERNAGAILPLIIFTNCDYVRFQFGEKKLPQKIFPRKEEFKGVAYPPVIIDDPVLTPELLGSWGVRWDDAVITGYYQDRAVIERRLAKNPLPTTLSVAADDPWLEAAQKDATRIVVKVLDQYGNLLPYLDEIIKIGLTGPGRVLGPRELVVKGGAIAFWVETLNQPGVIAVTVRSQSFGPKTVKIEVRSGF